MHCHGNIHCLHPRASGRNSHKNRRPLQVAQQHQLMQQQLVQEQQRHHLIAAQQQLLHAQQQLLHAQQQHDAHMHAVSTMGLGPPSDGPQLQQALSAPSAHQPFSFRQRASPPHAYTLDGMHNVGPHEDLTPEQQAQLQMIVNQGSTLQSAISQAQSEGHHATLHSLQQAGQMGGYPMNAGAQVIFKVPPAMGSHVLLPGIGGGKLHVAGVGPSTMAQEVGQIAIESQGSAPGQSLPSPGLGPEAEPSCSVGASATPDSQGAAVAVSAVTEERGVERSFAG